MFDSLCNFIYLFSLKVQDKISDFSWNVKAYTQPPPTSAKAMEGLSQSPLEMIPEVFATVALLLPDTTSQRWALTRGGCVLSKKCVTNVTAITNTELKFYRSDSIAEQYLNSDEGLHMQRLTSGLLLSAAAVKHCNFPPFPIAVVIFEATISYISNGGWYQINCTSPT